jgi:hypothetical protein
MIVFFIGNGYQILYSYTQVFSQSYVYEYSDMCNPTDHTTCAICLESCGEEDLHRLPCGHVFHRDCVSGWIKQHSSCPSCRQNPAYLADNDGDIVSVHWKLLPNYNAIIQDAANVAVERVRQHLVDVVQQNSFCDPHDVFRFENEWAAAERSITSLRKMEKAALAKARLGRGIVRKEKSTSSDKTHLIVHMDFHGFCVNDLGDPVTRALRRKKRQECGDDNCPCKSFVSQLHFGGDDFGSVILNQRSDYVANASPQWSTRSQSRLSRLSITSVSWKHRHWNTLLSESDTWASYSGKIRIGDLYRYEPKVSAPKKFKLAKASFTLPSTFSPTFSPTFLRVSPTSFKVGQHVIKQRGKDAGDGGIVTAIVGSKVRVGKWKLQSIKNYI